MKRVILWAMVLLLLAGCGQQKEETVCCVAEAELAVLQKDVAVAGTDSLELQRNLAMWYNQNLLQENDPSFREAYDTILFYSDGIMGSLEIPGKEIHQPIYHGTEGMRGIGHDPDSAFPIGQPGDHPVLRVWEEITLGEEDLFVIHILGETLTYRVAALRTERDTTPVPGMDYCSLILGDGTQLLAVRLEE